MAVSDDGGDSFGRSREMPGILSGDPAAAGTSTLHVPFVAQGNDAYLVQVSTTTDAGESFEISSVHEHDGTAEASYPALDDGPGERLYVAWTDPSGRLLVAGGHPDTGWTEPLLLNEGTQQAHPEVPPGIHVHDGLIDVTWYQKTDDARTYRLARLPVAGWNQTAPIVEEIGRFNSTEPVTDFATFDVGPDGPAVFAWTDPEVGLKVAGEAD